MSPSLLKSFSGRCVTEEINQQREKAILLSLSLQMISPTTVTSVSHSIKGNAGMQGIKEGAQGLLVADQLNRRSPESTVEERLSPKSFL